MIETEGIYALFPDGSAACVMSGEVAWFRLPGARTRGLRCGLYSIDMEFLGSSLEDIATHKEIESKCL